MNLAARYRAIINREYVDIAPAGVSPVHNMVYLTIA